MRRLRRFFYLLALALPLLAAPLANATTITPDTTADDNTGNGNCTLREAIIAANTNAAKDACPAGQAGKDTIILPSGTYTLSVPGQSEDNSATGDLDIRQDLEIIGDGQGATIIDGGQIDRVLHIPSLAGTIVVDISDVTIQGGSIPGYAGGGISNYGTGTLTVTNSTVSGSTATNGGGIQNAVGTVTLTNSIVSGNTSSQGGGGINNGGTLTLANSTVSGNTANGIGPGGGIRSSAGTLTITNSTFIGNTASGTGGGLNYYGTSTLTVTNSTFIGNSGSSGGGISNSGTGTLTITNSTVSGNTAINGGGIQNAVGTVTLTNSIVSGNTTSSGGGGINNGGTLTVTNSTVSGNTASSDGGGGIRTREGDLTLTNSTFAENLAPSGSVIYQMGGTDSTTLANVLLAGSCSGGTYISNGGNLESPGNTCGLTDVSDQPNTADPMIGALADNAGPTWTHALLPGSPAIDAALNANCPGTDQRGVLRPYNQICDIGAFEWGLGGSININDGDTYVPTPNVTLTIFTVGPPLTEVCLSNDGFGIGCSWQTFDLHEPWTLLPGEGQKTVYAQFRDPADPGTIYEDSDDIVVDESPPIAGDLRIDAVGPRALTASWFGSNDPMSDLKKIEYAVGIPGSPFLLTGGWVDATPAMSVTYSPALPYFFHPDTTYLFSLRLTNGAGLQTTEAVQGSFPGLSFTSQSITEGEALGPAFAASFTIGDELGIIPATIQVFLDGQAIAFEFDPSTSTITFNVNGLDLGSHTLRIEALDLSWNSLDETIAFLVTDPNVLVVNPSFTVVQPGEQKLFTGSGGNPGPLTWTLNCGDLGSDCGSLAVAGDGRSATLTAGQDPGTYIITAKDSQERADTASFAIDGSVKLSPTTISLGLGKEQVFTASGGRAPYSWTSSGGSGTPSGTQNEIYSYTAGQQVGSFAVRVQDADAKSATATLTVLRDHGRAIIVGGGGSASSNPILKETEFLTRFAYKAMNVKGFSRDDIYYLTPYGTDSTCGGPGPKYRPPWDGDGDGIRCNDVDGEATKANVQNAITQWAKTTAGVGPNVPLWIYLMDHGMPNQFLVNQTCTTIGCDNGPANTITATELDSWLDALEAAAPGTPIYLIYDACYSGSFIEELSAPNRLLLLSTRPDQLSYYSPNGSASFSSYVFTNLIAGLSALDSFVATRLGLPSSWHQTPGLDDNGNGAVNDQTDGNVARDVYLGAKAGGSALPVVVGGTASQTIEGDWPITLEASVLSDVQPDRVWVAIASPTDPMNVTEVDLVFADDPGTPEIEYAIDYPSGFPETGNWQLLFSAQVEGVASAPREITLTVTPSRKCGRVGDGPTGAGAWLALVLLPAAMIRAFRRSALPVPTGFIP